MEGCGNGRAALDHRLHDSLSPELVEHAVEVALELERGMHPRVLRSVAEHHAQRVAAFDMAHRERRIVGSHRAGADDHGVALGPETDGRRAVRARR